MGGRGAKGSVNDRIISFLYRKRYLEYLKKKDSYTKEQREKAKEYLKKIKEFDIDDNVSILDSEDKTILGNVYDNLLVDDFFNEPEKSLVITNDIEKVKGYEDVNKLKNISDPNTKISTLDSEDSLSELLEKSDKVQEFDPFKEEYDFDKYDYYEIISKKGGVGELEPSEIVNPEKEEKKLTDEEVILEEVTKFVDESKETLYEIKFELNDLKESVDELHTEYDVKKFNEKFNEIKEKINKLKKQYDVMKEKYDFEDYDILDNLKLVDSIEDYKDKASLEELELMVDACKYEIEAIDGIVIEEEKKVGIDEEVEQKHKIIKERDHVFQKGREQTLNIDYNSDVIEREMLIQKKVIADLEEKIRKVDTETRQVQYYVYNTRLMFRSFLRITAGILTAPFSGRRIFNTMLGADLINRGLRNLRTSLIPDERVRTEVRERYDSVETEILKAKDDVNSTKILIDDSLRQIDDIKDYLNVHVKKDAEYIPQYYEVKDMIEKLDKALKNKKEEIEKIDKNLDNQYEKNKQKVLRAQRGFHTPDGR